MVNAFDGNHLTPFTSIVVQKNTVFRVTALLLLRMSHWPTFKHLPKIGYSSCTRWAKVIKAHQMRELCESEKCMVRTLIRMQWGESIENGSTVFSEAVEERPKGARVRTWLNSDFLINFVNPRTVTYDHMSTMCPILPNTLGAELYLTVAKNSLAPMCLGLVGGRAFSIKYYEQYIQHTEKSLCELSQGIYSSQIHLLIKEQIQAGTLRIHDAKFARVIVVDRYIVFSYWPTSLKPELTRPRVTLVNQSNAAIDCYMDNATVVGLDGWITNY